jgi:putative ABC transport system ATP-binding protein
MELFSQLNRDEGLTIILVTHDLYVARNARRNVVLRDGEVVCDTPDYRVAAGMLQAGLET